MASSRPRTCTASCRWVLGGVRQAGGAAICRPCWGVRCAGCTCWADVARRSSSDDLQFRAVLADWRAAWQPAAAHAHAGARRSSRPGRLGRWAQELLDTCRYLLPSLGRQLCPVSGCGWTGEAVLAAPRLDDGNPTLQVPRCTAWATIAAVRRCCSCCCRCRPAAALPRWRSCSPSCLPSC